MLYDIDLNKTFKNKINRTLSRVVLKHKTTTTTTLLKVRLILFLNVLFKLHVCLYFAWTAISLSPKTAPLLRFYAIAMFTLFTSTGSLRGSHLPELHPPFTRTNRSPQSPILIVKMVYRILCLFISHLYDEPE